MFGSVQAMCFLSAFVQCMEAFKQCAFSADVQSKRAFRQWPSSVQGFNLWGGGGVGVQAMCFFSKVVQSMGRYKQRASVLQVFSL